MKFLPIMLLVAVLGLSLAGCRSTVKANTPESAPTSTVSSGAPGTAKAAATKDTTAAIPKNSKNNAVAADPAKGVCPVTKSSGMAKGSDKCPEMNGSTPTTDQTKQVCPVSSDKKTSAIASDSKKAANASEGACPVSGTSGDTSKTTPSTKQACPVFKGGAVKPKTK